ncbi:MAG: hypothetical protein HFE39_02760 [Clostridiales bacterium]|nr:hypothetical protein [Clostridiales bacterium]
MYHNIIAEDLFGISKYGCNLAEEPENIQEAHTLVDDFIFSTTIRHSIKCELCAIREATLLTRAYLEVFYSVRISLGMVDLLEVIKLYNSIKN